MEAVELEQQSVVCATSGRFAGYLKYLGIFFGSITIALLSLVTFSEPVSAACSASLSSSPQVHLNLSSDKTTGMVADEISVTTDCGAGYSVLVASTGADSTLYFEGDSTSSDYIAPSAGTPAAPSSLFGAGESTHRNIWGYSIDSATTMSSDTFVGLTDEPALLFDKYTVSEEGGDMFAVYYGASVEPNLRTGSYRMSDGATVEYYLIARSLDFEITGNPTEWTNQSVELTVESDFADIISEYSFDGGETWQNTPSKTYDNNTSGIEVKVKNLSGWVSTGQVVDVTKIDKSAPEISFDKSIEYNADHTTKYVSTLIATLGDDTSIFTGLNIKENGASGVASTWPKCYYKDAEVGSTNVFTDVGRYLISCVARDVAGNEATSAREVLIRWPTGGQYVVAKTTSEGAGVKGASAAGASDGLYADSVETGADADLPFASKYYYAGHTVDNYIAFAGEQFRILNISTNDDIKLIGAVSTKNVSMGAAKIYDSAAYASWSGVWWPNGQLYDSDDDNYRVFSADEKSHIALATFFAGRVDEESANTVAHVIRAERGNPVQLGDDSTGASFQGYSAYPNLSDFLKASTAQDVTHNIHFVGVDCTGAVMQEQGSLSWIDTSLDVWTMNGGGQAASSQDFFATSSECGGRIELRSYMDSLRYRPVFYLLSDTILSGDGSINSPYTVQEDWAWFDSAQTL